MAAPSHRASRLFLSSSCCTRRRCGRFSIYRHEMQTNSKRSSLVRLSVKRTCLSSSSTGKVSINGKQVAINADFANQVNFISQQLNCSERIVSGLLLDVVAENPNLTAPRYVDMVLLEYHLRRRQLTDCLRLIFEAVNLDDPNANPTVSRMLHYAMIDLNAAPASPSQSSFSSVLLREIDFLSTTLEATENARRSAQTNTVAPSAQSEPSVACSLEHS